MTEAQPRVAIVTGGADGFGSAIVDRFLAEGCKVLFIDLNEAKGTAKAATKPNDLTFMPGDVSQLDTWERALSTVQEKYGRIDIVVNNAGITHANALVHELKIEDFDKVFNVNVKPIFLSAQVLCPFMQKQGNGVFINLTSTGCSRPRPGFSFYNASKAAVRTASKTMALEYAPAIRFNCICPAVGDTTMLQASIGDGADAQERRRKLAETLPMKRITAPTDIANAAWFLASDQSSFMTGTTIEVDGGRGV